MLHHPRFCLSRRAESLVEKRVASREHISVDIRNSDHPRVCLCCNISALPDNVCTATPHPHHDRPLPPYALKSCRDVEDGGQPLHTCTGPPPPPPTHSVRLACREQLQRREASFDREQHNVQNIPHQRSLCVPRSAVDSWVEEGGHTGRQQHNEKSCLERESCGGGRPHWQTTAQ